MRFLSNCHTHSRWCDGADDISALLEQAQALGFVSLGLSGHACQGFDPDYSMAPKAQRGYLSELRAMQRAARPGQPRLWAGLELDALADDRRRRAAYAKADYIIGSAHYLCGGGEPVAVDGDPARLKRHVDAAFAGDGLEMARAYFALETEALLRDRPQVIGHFDLVRKHAASCGLFDENSASYRHMALDALERASACGGVMEINTGGMARGYLPSPYPTRELLGAWRELGGQITLSSDCHDRRLLNYAFDEAAALARSVGFRTALRLGAGNALWEETPL